MSIEDYFAPAREKAFRKDIHVDGSREVLRCPALVASDNGAENYRRLAEHLKLDFSQIAELLDHLPVFQEGEAHAQTRAEIAKMIAQTSKERGTVLREAASKFDRLGQTGPVELMQDVIKPSVDILFTNLIGVDISKLDISELSLVLTDGIGIRQRRRLEKQLKDLDDALRAQFPDASPREIQFKKTLVAMGHDSTMGSAALSMLQMIMDHPGKTFAQMPFPDLFSHTGVPFIRRTARDDVSFAEQSIPKGHDVSVMLNIFDAPSPDADRKLIFGLGRHVCLGGPVSMQYWQAVTHVVSGIDRKAVITQIDEKQDTLFRIPDTVLLEIS